jgi:hypothetical protein
LIVFFPLGWEPGASAPVLERYRAALVSIPPGEEGGLLHAIYASAAGRPARSEELRANRASALFVVDLAETLRAIEERPATVGLAAVLSRPTPRSQELREELLAQLSRPTVEGDLVVFRVNRWRLFFSYVYDDESLCFSLEALEHPEYGRARSDWWAEVEERTMRLEDCDRALLRRIELFSFEHFAVDLPEIQQYIAQQRGEEEPE